MDKVDRKNPMAQTIQEFIREHIQARRPPPIKYIDTDDSDDDWSDDDYNTTTTLDAIVPTATEPDELLPPPQM